MIAPRIHRTYELKGLRHEVLNRVVILFVLSDRTQDETHDKDCGRQQNENPPGRRHFKRPTT